jgi:hypothetical protein
LKKKRLNEEEKWSEIDLMEHRYLSWGCWLRGERGEYDKISRPRIMRGRCVVLGGHFINQIRPQHFLCCLLKVVFAMFRK